MQKKNKDNYTKPYQGPLSFNNQTVTFGDTTIQLRNVSRLFTDEVPQPHVISPKLLLIAILVFVVTIYLKGPAFIWLIAATIIGYSVYEYARTKLYALFIEMNSSFKHYVNSKDLNGLKELQNELNEKMISNTSTTSTVYFQGDKIIFGDNYEVNNSDIGQMGSFDNPEVS